MSSKETFSEKSIANFWAKHGCTEIVQEVDFCQITDRLLQFLGRQESLESLLITLHDLSSNNPGLHFNFNTSIKRLLICRYPRKITLFPRSDHHAFSSYDKSSFLDLGSIGIYVGEFTKDKHYEETRLAEVKSTIRQKADPDTILIGCYGQLSFVNDRARKLLESFFGSLLQIKQTQSVAMILSGSRLGVSGIAYQRGLAQELPIIGIIPASVAHAVNSQEFTDLIIEGDDWGDGSFLFGRLPDYLIFAGGGYWSFLEYEQAKINVKPVTFLTFEGAQYCSEMQSTEDFRNAKNCQDTTLENIVKEIKDAISDLA